MLSPNIDAELIDIFADEIRIIELEMLMSLRQPLIIITPLRCRAASVDAAITLIEPADAIEDAYAL